MATLTAAMAAADAPAKALHEGVNSIEASYDLAASLSVGDVILLGKIPQGAHIVDGYLNLQCTGTAIAFTLGDGGDANRYIDTTSLSAQGVVRFSAAAMNDYSFTAGEVVKMTMTGAATSATATGNIKLVMQYAMDV